MTTKKDLRIIFGGTPDFAAEHLNALINNGYNIVCVYTQPDREAGRGRKLTASPVKEIALKNNIPIEQPINFKEESSIEIFKKYCADLFVVVAYGIILPKSILDNPTFGCINVHGSLLPKYRGAAPIQRAIFNGEKETGITVMRMNEGLDTGDMILKSSCPISPTDTSESLFNKLIPIGCNALIETLELITSNKCKFDKQDDNQATYASKITKEEALLDWNEDAQMLDRRIRTYNSWPLAKFCINETVIKIHKASPIMCSTDKKPGTILSADKTGIKVATSNGVLNLEILQFPGKKSMPVADILNGYGNWFTIDRCL